jgi:hypothetical protein
LHLKIFIFGGTGACIQCLHMCLQNRYKKTLFSRAVLGSQQNEEEGTEIVHTPTVTPDQHPHQSGTFTTVDEPA